MRKHVIITSAIAIVIGFFAMWASLVSVAFALGDRAYERSNYSDAATSYSIAARVLPGTLGGWKGHYGRGSSELHLGSIDSGIAELRRALIDVPKTNPDELVETENPDEFTEECKVRFNLGIGLEIEGDRYNEATNYAEAELSYREASAVVEHCVPQSPQHQQQKDQTDQKANEAGQNQEQQQGGGDGDGGQGGDDGQDGGDDGDGQDGQGGDGGQDGGDDGDGQDGQGGDGGQGGGDDGDGQDGQGGDGGQDGEGTDPWEGHNSGKERELRERGKEAEKKAREGKGREGGYSDWDGQNW